MVEPPRPSFQSSSPPPPNLPGIPGDPPPGFLPPGAYPHPGPPPRAPERPEGLGPPPEPSESAGPRWAPWSAPAALVTGFAVAIFGALLIGAISAAFGAKLDKPPPSVNILATVVQDLALIGAALFFASRESRPAPWHFGLRGTPLWRAVGWLVATWVTFFIFSAIWVAALGIKEKDKLPSELGADKSTIALAAVAVLVTVIAPIAEEIFFRGYFFVALRNWRGFWPAAILTALVFGGIHAGSSPAGFLVPLALFGFGLCWLYQRTGSLYPCIALHALNNSLAFGVTQGWGWQIPLLMLGSNAAIFSILVLVTRRDSSQPATA
jgi:membrane protease YdiL (CAAX protease family)